MGYIVNCKLKSIARKATISEAELIEGLRSKKQSALEYLYDHYAHALYGIIVRIIPHEDMAEEVLQDGFMKIWEKIQSYDATKGRLFTWMLNIVRNLAIDKTRSKEFSQSRKTDDIDNFVSSLDSARNTELAVDAIGIKELLGKLPEEQRFVVEKIYLGGYTHAEVSDEFGLPLGTVKTRIRTAMIELRHLLQIN